MKVLILGDGKFATELVKQTNWPFISRKKDQININSKSSYKLYIENFYVVINCIAYTDTYSVDKEKNWNVNVKFVKDLCDICNELNKKLIHISTDYLYSGSKEVASEEDVPVHLPTWYGYTKLIGDAIVQLELRDYLICRLSFKENPFPYKAAWSDIKTNTDYIDVIAKLTIELINKGASGIYNIGTEVKSIYELAKKTNKVKPINRPPEVPFDTSMNINKLLRTLNE